MRRVRLALVIVVACAAIAPSTAAAADPTPTRPGTIVFTAGTHTAYRFSSSGAILASKQSTAPRQSSASTDGRVWVTGRGWYIRVVNGALAGYVVRESPLAYVRGIVGEQAYNPAINLSFPAGTYNGYAFDAAWNMASAKRFTTRPAGAHSDRRAVINGVSYHRITDGVFAGRWIPLTGGALKPIDCRAGNRVPVGSQQVFARIPGAGHAVALTFDMGGRIDPALAIMDYLLLHRVCATIFPTGAMSQTTVGSAVLARIRAHPELFEVGNHTMHHCDLVTGGGGSPSTAPCPGTRPSASFVQRQLTDGGSIIAAGSGQQPSPYWRPPYGSHDAAVRNAAAAVGYTKTLMWDIDTIDWKPVAEGGPTAHQMAASVLSRSVDGSNVLMHLGGWSTLDALPAMVYGLRGKGFVLTSISDMLN